MSKSRVLINDDCVMQIRQAARKLRNGFFEKGEAWMIAEKLDGLADSVDPLNNCDWCGEEYPDSMLMNETQAGDAICNDCAEGDDE